MKTCPRSIPGAYCLKFTLHGNALDHKPALLVETNRVIVANLIGVALLSPVAFRLIRDYFAKKPEADLRK